MIVHMEEEEKEVATCAQIKDKIKQIQQSRLLSCGHVSRKIILLFSLALDETYAVFKISFARIPHALGAEGPNIFHFVVIFWFFGCSPF
jgi:uncharacterized membrane protein